jgi:hypothetical protein
MVSIAGPQAIAGDRKGARRDGDTLRPAPRPDRVNDAAVAVRSYAITRRWAACARVRQARPAGEEAVDQRRERQ